MALQPIQVESFYSNRLSLESEPELIVDEPLVHRSEPALTDEIAPREVGSRSLQLGEGEGVELGAMKGAGDDHKVIN